MNDKDTQRTQLHILSFQSNGLIRSLLAERKVAFVCTNFHLTDHLSIHFVWIPGPRPLVHDGAPMMVRKYCWICGDKVESLHWRPPPPQVPLTPVAKFGGRPHLHHHGSSICAKC